jgi:hypothetical protein
MGCSRKLQQKQPRTSNPYHKSSHFPYSATERAGEKGTNNARRGPQGALFILCHRRPEGCICADMREICGLTPAPAAGRPGSGSPPDTRNLCFSKTVLSFQHDIGVEENKYICGLTSEVYIKIKINLLSISILLKR